MDFDVVIVGAGPAGIFSAYELIKKDPKLKIVIIEMGKSIEEREKTDLMSGFGGAGTFSDGKLHYSPVLSHEKMLDLYSTQEYQEYLDYVDKVFSEFGVDAEYYPRDVESAKRLIDQAQKNSIKLFLRKIQHVGSDKLPKIIKNFEDFFEKNGVKIMTDTEVTGLLIENNQCNGVVLKNGNHIPAKNVVVAPGRLKAKWLQQVAKKYGLGYDYEKVEIGVRVEFPEELMKKFSEVMYEAVFHIITPTFDDVVRSFCPCPKGKVAIEDYDGFVCVNGHSNSNHDSKNSNFAFVSEVVLTEPVENTIDYANSIAKLATTIGGGKPILQRLKDLKKGRRSTWERIQKSHVDPSLKEVTPGDISMALPHRIVTNLIEGLEILDSVMPGINSDSTLLYAPEIKLRSSKMKTSKNLETAIKNLYVAGDGAGVSGNIVGAAATGIIAARGILETYTAKQRSLLDPYPSEHSL